MTEKKCASFPIKYFKVKLTSLKFPMCVTLRRLTFKRLIMLVFFVNSPVKALI